MAFWLFKEEPSEFSFADLVDAGGTDWGGIANAMALKNLRQCQPGDLVFFYHTGKEKSIVGIMEIEAGVKPKSEAVSVRVTPVAALGRPVTLAEIKADKSFDQWDLVRNSRLSVMPVPAGIWRKIKKMARKPL